MKRKPYLFDHLCNSTGPVHTVHEYDLGLFSDKVLLVCSGLDVRSFEDRDSEGSTAFPIT